MIIQTFTQIVAVIASANEDKYAYLMLSLPYEHIHMKSGDQFSFLLVNNSQCAGLCHVRHRCVTDSSNFAQRIQQSLQLVYCHQEILTVRTCL